MTIKVYGGCCGSCGKLLENVKTALAEIKSDATLVYTDDINGVMGSGVTQVPAIAVDDKIVSEGVVLSIGEIIDLIS